MLDNDGTMNKISVIIAISFAIATAIASRQRGKDQTEPERSDDQLKERLQACGFQVSTDNLEANQVVRFRGGYEELMRLANPGSVRNKPPLPADLDIDSLPKYWGGCPHCGKMSMCGENQWRYQELSRTRGPYDNTTTYLAKCQNCKGFMKTTVDHDD
jgi:hypothetical protein